MHGWRVQTQPLASILYAVRLELREILVRLGFSPDNGLLVPLESITALTILLKMEMSR